MDLTKISTEERQKGFINELQGLLKKYNVELCVESDNKPYFESYDLVLNFNSELKGDDFVEFSELNVGTYLDSSVNVFKNKK